jgi:predicted phosphodiesterase
MNFSRRDFLKGSVALAEFSALGGFAFALPAGWRPKKNPKLVFGVLADTHIRSDSEWHSGKKSDKFLVSALEYFRSQNVDAVVHCGDMADRGLVDELQFHADAWYRVFPGNRAPDGHIVEKLFVTGNHDIDSWYRDIDMTQFVPEKKEWSEKIINEDVARHWKRIWGEEYNLLWHKSVKGYHFFGRNWFGDDRDKDEDDFLKFIKTTMVSEKTEGENESFKPFFFVSHDCMRPKFRRNIARVRGGFGLWGHWHVSASNWNVLRMLNPSTPGIQCPACPSWWRPNGKWMGGGDAHLFKVPIEEKLQGGKWEQGLIVRVYDDMMIIEGREFSEGGSLGVEWMMPFSEISEKKQHPFSRNELQKIIGCPQFRKGAKMTVKMSNEASSKELIIKIPLADGNPKTRVYAYEVVVAGNKKSEKLVKAVYAAGCNMSIDKAHGGGVTVLGIPMSEMPGGDRYVINVRPITSLGTFGKSIRKVVAI